MPLTAITGRESPTVGSSTAPSRIAVPIVQRPAHAGADWTWEHTGHTLNVDEADAKGRNLIAITVLGTCMEPWLLAGDLVLIDTWDRQPRDRAMAAISHGNQVAIRWIKADDRGHVTFIDESGVTLRGRDLTLEGIVYQRITPTPRRPDWNDLSEPE